MTYKQMGTTTKNGPLHHDTLYRKRLHYPPCHSVWKLPKWYNCQIVFEFSLKINVALFQNQTFWMIFKHCVLYLALFSITRFILVCSVYECLIVKSDGDNNRKLDLVGDWWRAHLTKPSQNMLCCLELRWAVLLTVAVRNSQKVVEDPNKGQDDLASPEDFFFPSSYFFLSHIFQEMSIQQMQNIKLICLRWVSYGRSWCAKTFLVRNAILATHH